MIKKLFKPILCAVICGTMAFSGLVTAFSAENGNPQVLAEIKKKRRFSVCCGKRKCKTG